MTVKNKNRYAALLIAGLAVLQFACVSSASGNHQPPNTGAAAAQSPIDVVTANLVQGETGTKPEFHYAATAFKVENNGHTVEFVPADAGNYLVLDGKRFVVQQAHFHAPSEHTVDGGAFAMELHIVHKNDQGGIAVLGLLITPGAENAPLREAFSRLPASEGLEIDLETPVDLGALAADKTVWYRYAGSLTTPPYTEGVQWLIAPTPVELSQAQIDAFTALYPANNRAVQNVNRRVIFTAQ